MKSLERHFGLAGSHFFQKTFQYPTSLLEERTRFTRILSLTHFNREPLLEDEQLFMYDGSNAEDSAKIFCCEETLANETDENLANSSEAPVRVSSSRRRKLRKLKQMEWPHVTHILDLLEEGTSAANVAGKETTSSPSNSPWEKKTSSQRRKERREKFGLLMRLTEPTEEKVDT